MRSFYGVLLHDAEGKLGVLGFESSEPLVFDPDVQDLLQILVNQATVSVRNTRPKMDLHKDARACLEAANNKAVIKCANKYR